MYTIFEQSPYFIFLILFLATTHSIFSVAVIARLSKVRGCSGDTLRIFQTTIAVLFIKRLMLRGSSWTYFQKLLRQPELNV